MSIGFPPGSFKRRVAKYGEDIDLRNDAVATDENTDWNDQTVTTTTTTVPGVIQKQRTGVITRTEEGDEVEVDAAIYVHDDELGAFPIRDGAEGSPTVVTARGVEFVVLTETVRPNGVHEIEVSRV